MIVGVDMGGTFTDVYGLAADGTVRTAKAPTTPDAVGGVLAALRQVCDPAHVESITFGSTVATNAVVERRLAPVGLLTTAGFRDLLDIRRLWRPRLFGHDWDRPAPLVPRRLRLEVRERLDWRGRVVESLNEEDVIRAAAVFAAEEVGAVAIAFLFAYVSPMHERRAAELIADATGRPVLCSCDVDPQRREYERTSTTVVAAGLSPVVGPALDALEAELAGAGLARPLRLMTSNGGVATARRVRSRPLELLKSGPAGGAAAGEVLARRLGVRDLILIDIGGTTADVSLITDGRAAHADVDSLEWDIPIRVANVDIRSIGAGGGSIASIDAGGALHVGPQSAGADPGPAGYGRGGTRATVTDAAVVCGAIDAARFLGGAMPLDGGLAGAAVARVGAALRTSTEAAGAAILYVATAQMAELVRGLTVERGRDPRDFSLVAFGGAGPLFAGLLMDELGLRCAIIPIHAATLSAIGGAHADIVVDEVRTVVDGDIAGALVAAAADARTVAANEGHGEPVVVTSVDVRYVGQSSSLVVEAAPEEPPAVIGARFEEAYGRLFGHRRSEIGIEVTAARARARVEVATPSPAAPPPGDGPRSERTLHLHGRDALRALVVDRVTLVAGSIVAGPAIVEEDDATTVVLPGQAVRRGDGGELWIERHDD